MNEEETPAAAKGTPSALEIAEFCEKTLYRNKAERIIRFDLAGFDWAQADHYIVCTGISTPHLAALAERLRRDIRSEYGLRPFALDGAAQSQWVIVDFGSVMVHILSDEARERYQLEELWNDAPQIDAVRKLDEEHARRDGKGEVR